MIKKDSRAAFMAGYDSGYEQACKDWEEKIDKIEEAIERKMSEYDSGDVSDSIITALYEDCLAIIDAIVGTEDK